MNDTFPVAQALPASDPLDGEPELRKELAGLFLESCEQSLSTIQQLISDRKASELRKEAHTLKGSIGVFRDQAAFNAAFQMEMIGSHAAWDRAEAACETLRAETRRLAAVLARFIHQEVPCTLS
jgi:HPt (histidine-containing phosphotransfer) domain-containing protein